jgi:hypothetical protein
MGIASLVIGIVSISGVCVSLVPLLNVANCFSLPLALLGLIFGLIDVLRDKPAGESKTAAIIGLVLNGLALLVGGVRVTISILTTGGLV